MLSGHPRERGSCFIFCDLKSIAKTTLLLLLLFISKILFCYYVVGISLYSLSITLLFFSFRLLFITLWFKPPVKIQIICVFASTFPPLFTTKRPHTHTNTHALALFPISKTRTPQKSFNFRRIVLLCVIFQGCVTLFFPFFCYCLSISLEFWPFCKLRARVWFSFCNLLLSSILKRFVITGKVWFFVCDY